MRLSDKTFQSLLWFVALLAIAWYVRPKLDVFSQRQGLAPERFWQDKLAAGPDFDIVVAGDSRVYRSVATSEIERAMTNARAINFGFSSAGFEPRYFDRVEALLEPSGHRIIVLGLSSFSLTPRATRSNGFLDRLERKFTLADVIPVLLDRFEPVAPKDLLGLAGLVSGPIYHEDYRADGWVPSNQSPPDETRALAPYRSEFADNQVSAEAVDTLLDRVRAWSRRGVRVIGLRMPVSRALRRLEDELSGMEWTKFAARFEAAGGEWLSGLSHAVYPTYDGSHMAEDAAVRFSRALALEITYPGGPDDGHHR